MKIYLYMYMSSDIVSYSHRSVYHLMPSHGTASNGSAVLAVGGATQRLRITVTILVPEQVPAALQDSESALTEAGASGSAAGGAGS